MPRWWPKVAIDSKALNRLKFSADFALIEAALLEAKVAGPKMADVEGPLNNSERKSATRLTSPDFRHFDFVRHFKFGHFRSANFKQAHFISNNHRPFWKNYRSFFTWPDCNLFPISDISTLRIVSELLFGTSESSEEHSSITSLIIPLPWRLLNFDSSLKIKYYN